LDIGIRRWQLIYLLVFDGGHTGYFGDCSPLSVCHLARDDPG